MLYPTTEHATRLSSTTGLAHDIGATRQKVIGMMTSLACAAYDSVRHAMNIFIQKAVHQCKRRSSDKLVQP
eukprot:5528607-Pyramimonas_sp.AAC.1